MSIVDIAAITVAVLFLAVVATEVAGWIRERLSLVLVSQLEEAEIHRRLTEAAETLTLAYRHNPGPLGLAQGVRITLTAPPRRQLLPDWPCISIEILVGGRPVGIPIDPRMARRRGRRGDLRARWRHARASAAFQRRFRRLCLKDASRSALVHFALDRQGRPLEADAYAGSISPAVRDRAERAFRALEAGGRSVRDAVPEAAREIERADRAGQP